MKLQELKKTTLTMIVLVTVAVYASIINADVAIGERAVETEQDSSPSSFSAGPDCPPDCPVKN